MQYSQTKLTSHLFFKPAELRNKWRFVVKLHQATRLHYDLRLEMPGALKSWVIAIGDLSMKAGAVCEAYMTPDHNPNFIFREGVIPKGQYGAGEILVYDRGVYYPFGACNDKKLAKEIMADALQKGNVEFFIMGHRLKGNFRLTRLSKYEKKWHLTKLNDMYCHDNDINKINNSILTGLTIQDIQNNRYRSVV